MSGASELVERLRAELWPGRLGPQNADELVIFIKEERAIDQSARREAVEDARKHLAELSASRAEAGRLREALKEARRAIGDHHAPSDCYATGPLTGDPFRDLVQCPACSFIAMYDAALAGEKPVGAGVETLATDYLRGKIGEIIALQLDIEGGRAVEQAVEQILAVAALSKSGEKP